MRRIYLIFAAILACTFWAITSCSLSSAGKQPPEVELLVKGGSGSAASQKYRDGRPAATLRMDAQDQGIVLHHGDGPGKCDLLGARDVWVFEDKGTYYMHYDAAGPEGWLCSAAVSKDLLTWEKKGPVLGFGKPGEDDSKSASYGVTYREGNVWHMYYLGTPNVSDPPDLVPMFPYLTMKAKGESAAGPWIKQKEVVPFRTKQGTYYSITASPGQIVKRGDEYLQFFSATTEKSGNPSVQRTLGIARTKNLDGPWTVDPQPMVPIEEQIENSSIYYEKSNKTWFLFTNHIGIDEHEYTDAIWVYWTKDLNHWDPEDKAVVLDGQNCNWSRKCIGLPSVIPFGERLALFYDAPGGESTSHMKRDVGLAWLDLPLAIPEKDEITVAAYYFPNYHKDRRNEVYFGEGWTEWELVKAAKPRFPNHHQPNVPAWGYTDEADPVQMAQKIDAAAEHGIDAFIFDWYMYEDGPFLYRCLEVGFLKAKNCERVKFGLMWANHDWVDIHPYTLGEEQKLIYPGKVSPNRFDKICDFVIKEYFTKPNYWKIDGKPYFSVYDVQKFVEGFGSMEATKAAMDRMREKAVKAGLKGVHWNLVAWGNPILPVEKAPSNTPELIKMLGFDSSTSYVWIHHVPLPETQTGYNYVRDAYFEYWDKAKKEYAVPYYPNVTMGWDPSPRCDLNSEWAPVGYPFMNTIGNNTPENFKTALQMTKKKLLADPDGPRVLNINCWNEWTEGSYLEPDLVNGMRYLEAVKDVFKPES